MSLVSVVTCEAYEAEAVERAVEAVLAPLGGIGRFVRPGMQVLLKPNLLVAADLERAITTHPAVVQAVAKQVQEAGGTVLIGDSPAGSIQNGPLAWRRCGLEEVAARTVPVRDHFSSPRGPPTLWPTKVAPISGPVLSPVHSTAVHSGLHSPMRGRSEMSP